jgi:hypothetical protein
MSMQVAVRSNLFCGFSEPQTFPLFKQEFDRLASISPQIPTSSAILRTRSGALSLPAALLACALATP